MWLILFIFVIAAVVQVFKARHKTQSSWLQTPTLDHYWNLYPQCRTHEGTTCFKCGSKQQRSWGVDSSSDSKRFHICHQCNLRLYRTGP